MQDLGTITPSLEEFRARAAGTRVIPVHIKILADSLTPIGIYRSLVLQNDQGEPVEAAHGTFLLESAKISAEGESAAWDRYSFIGASSPPWTAQSTGRAAPPPAHPSTATP